MSKWSGRFVVAALVAVLMSGTVGADEVATIVNGSELNIELYLRWSNLPNESAKIVLRPGDERRVRGPVGAKLFMRWNSTPGMNNPPAELKVRVVTADVGGGAGYTSTFRHKNPQVVELFGE